MANEQRLWAAVILRALEDASSRSWKMRYERDDAIAWFQTRDFRTVCDYAGLDPQWVLENIPRVLKRKWGAFL